jgi:hypothetical protein
VPPAVREVLILQEGDTIEWNIKDRTACITKSKGEKK